MEKFGAFFSSYASAPSSPILGRSRRNGTSRMVRLALILATVIVTGSLVLLGTRNREYITHNLPNTFKVGKLLSPTHDKENTTSSTSSSKADPFKLPPKTVAQVQNASLGFERVMLINLPKRSDKLDASTLAASFTGFNFTVVEGVKNEDVAAVSLPWVFDEKAPNVHGCWRAHLNAIRTVVHEGLSSALIIEDDSDWDVNLKAQLASIAAGTQKLQCTAEKHKEPHSPYGDGWDLLWLGHCASSLRTDAARMLIHNDPTVRPPSKKWEMWDPEFNAKGVTNSTRVVSKANNAICTNGYAVSLAGARKILYHASFHPNPDAIDQRFNNLCDPNHAKEHSAFECLHVYPAIFNAYRKAGRADGESDQSNGQKKGKDKVKMRKFGYAYNNVYSTMLNLGNLIQGKQPEAQWKMDGWETERELDESAGVSLEWQEAGWGKFAMGLAEEKTESEQDETEKKQEEEQMKKKKEEEEESETKKQQEEELKKPST